MSWTRLDDNWFVKRQAEGLSLAEIGYFVGLIQYCSRTNSYDGRIKAFYARTIAECDDSDAIINHLAEAGHVTWDNGHLILTRIDDYTPPLHMRDEDKKAFDRDRKRRQRAHKAGDHSLCQPSNCPTVVPCDNTATSQDQGPCPTDVTQDTGTGQAGTERTTPDTESKIPAQAGGRSAPPPCGVDLATGEVAYKPCAVCGSTTGDCGCFDDSGQEECGWCGPGRACVCPSGPVPVRRPNDST